MSFEKPSVPSKNETLREAHNSKAPSPVKAENSAERSFDLSKIISPESVNFFNRMSDKGKSFAAKVYEGVYKTPGVNRLLGKAEIAYNNFWIGRHEKKAVGLKGKLDNLNLKDKNIDQSKQEMRAMIEDFKKNNIPGSESLELKIKDLDQEKNNIINQQNKIQSKLEKRENSAKIYTNRRDTIADKLISGYDNKIESIEGKFKDLETRKNAIDLAITVAEIKHKERESYLAKIESRRDQLKDSLRRSGMTDKEIESFGGVKDINKVLKQAKETLTKEKNIILNKKMAVQEKISKINSKLSKYKDRKDQIVGVKESRPLRIERPERFERENNQKREDISSQKRTKMNPEDHSSFENPISAESIEDSENESVENSLSRWNNYLEENYGNNLKAGETVELEDFSRCTGIYPEHVLGLEDFRRLLRGYYKFKKIDLARIDGEAEEFFEKNIKKD